MKLEMILKSHLRLVWYTTVLISAMLITTACSLANIGATPTQRVEENVGTITLNNTLTPTTKISSVPVPKSTPTEAILTDTPMPLENQFIMPTAVIDTPTAKATTWNYPLPDLVAVEPCNVIMPSDGSRLYFECGINVFEPSSSNELVFQKSAESISYESPIISPNGQWLVYVEKIDGSSKLRVVSANNWDNDRPLTDPFGLGLILKNLSWSFDSQWIAFEEYSWGSRTGTTYITNIATGEVKTVGEGIGSAFAWSPIEPEQFVFAAGEEGSTPWESVYLSNTETPQNKELIEGINTESFEETFRPFLLEWNPKEQLLGFCLGNLYKAELWFFDFASNEWRLIDTFGESGCTGMDWAPDGQSLAVYSYQYIRFFQVPDWQVSYSLSSFKNEIMTSAVVKNGNWVSDNVFVYSVTNEEPFPSFQIYDLFAVSLDGDSYSSIGLWHVNAQDLHPQFDSINMITSYYRSPLE